MKRTFLLLCLICLAMNNMAQSFDYTKIGTHPRLLMRAGEEKKIREGLNSNPSVMKVHKQILNYCDEVLLTPNVTRIMEGKRLLAVSREAFKRIFYLSYAYRITGEKKYEIRAEQEMLAVSAFTDWNPSHYLDVGEMTMAVAIGYDWLYQDLKPSTRETVRKAIVEKGFDSSKNAKDAWFYTSNNNWNQVCNAGLVYGAIAVFEDEPDAATSIIEKCMKTIQQPMGCYGPDGNYVEGYMYWGYGTGFQVMLLAALDSTFGTDNGLSATPGFLQSAQYIEYMTGTSGLSFNFSDARENGLCNPMMFWFAQKSNNPSLLWVEKDYLKKDTLELAEERLMPCLPIFAANFNLSQIAPPTKKIWVGHGKTPVILVRTGWKSKNDLYLGIKGGSASASHAHMDVGSFVFDAKGIRWAMDLGMQEYITLESKGVDLWNPSQQSQRWEVLRLSLKAHNTLTINDKNHSVKGFAPILKTYEKGKYLGGEFDLTSTFGGDLKKAVRKAVLVDEKYLEVTDFLEATDKTASIRWTMCTPAEAKIIDDRTIELTKNGEKLRVQIVAPFKTISKIWSNEPEHSYDATNPGTLRIGFEAKLNAGQKAAIKVRLMPL